jgi:hypothetical protein
MIGASDLISTEKIEFGGLTIYEKRDPIYESKIIGVPLYMVAIAGVVIWLVTKK